MSKQLESSAGQPGYSKVPGVSCSEVEDMIRATHISRYIQCPSEEVLVVVFSEQPTPGQIWSEIGPNICIYIYILYVYRLRMA